MKNSSLWGGLLLHDFSLAWFVFELPLWKSSCLITLEIWSLVLNLVLLSSKSRLTKHWFHSFYVYLNRKLDRIGDSLPTKGLSSLVSLWIVQMAVRSMNWAVLQERNDSQIIFFTTFFDAFCNETNVWHIGKYEYIDTWILRIYRKNIDGYFYTNIGETKIIQNWWECLENSKEW